MKNILEKSRRLNDAVRAYLPSAYGGFHHRKLWQELETFCLFVGYPRSGHSLIGALLNAHPNIAISHELDALKYVYARFSRSQIYDLIYKKSQVSAEKDRKLGGYNYHIPNQWQGRIQSLKVIGDKQGEGTILRVASHSGHLERLRKILDIPVKFIHVVRNPYDNISTISRKTPKLGFDLERSIEHYFYLCKSVSDFKETLDEKDFLELKHEDFLENPQAQLENMCFFLGLETPKDYLADCSSIVKKSPHKSRSQVSWSPVLIESVAEKIEKFPFLQGYTYDD